MRDPAAPFITFYDDATGERIELSRISFDNWAAKTANLLVDEFDAEPGTAISLDLPLHWILPVWHASVLLLGARISADEPAVKVIGPNALEDAMDNPTAELVACSLRPMAQGFPDALPFGIADYFAEVRLHGDHFAGSPTSPEPADSARAMELARSCNFTEGGRLLVSTASDISSAASHDLLPATYLVPSLNQGSAVLIRNANPARAEQIASQEAFTAHLPLD